MGVDLKTPPTNEQFQEFHGPTAYSGGGRPKRYCSISPTQSRTVPRYDYDHGGAMPYLPYGGHWYGPGMPGPPSFQSGPSSFPSAPTTSVDQPSSDPPDMNVANPYPTLDTFLQLLHERYPQRQLDQKIYSFASNDYYHIDDIAGLTQDYLMDDQKGIGLSGGNAKFLLEQVAFEIKRVDQANGKKKAKG